MTVSLIAMFFKKNLYVVINLKNVHPILGTAPLSFVNITWRGAGKRVKKDVNFFEKCGIIIKLIIQGDKKYE